MPIRRDEVEHVALLARLALDESTIQRLTTQLGSILDYVEKLSRLRTQDVEPLAHPLPMSNVFRPDEPGRSLERDEALKNAPKQRNGLFEVPPIIQ